MAEIRNIDLGAILGTAEGIKSQRQANVAAEQQNRLDAILNPMKAEQAQREIDMQAALQEGQIFLNTLGDVSQLPEQEQQAAWANARETLRRYGSDDVDEIPELYDPQALQGIQGLVSSQRSESIGNIGTFNPRDYTTESFSKFAQTNDPSVLERYESKQKSQLRDVGGVPTLFQFDDFGNVSNVKELRTPQDVADAKALIASKEQAAKSEAETAGSQQAAFESVLGKEAGQVYSNLQQAAQQASQFMPKLEGLKEMAAAGNTGAYARMGLFAQRYLGLDVADTETLNAALMGMAQDVLSQQTGTKTDFDFQVAVEQSASLGKTPEANVALINALIERQEAAIRFGDMAKAALDEGGPKAILDLRYTAPPSKDVSVDDLLEKYK